MKRYHKLSLTEKGFLNILLLWVCIMQDEFMDFSNAMRREAEIISIVN